MEMEKSAKAIPWFRDIFSPYCRFLTSGRTKGDEISNNLINIPDALAISAETDGPPPQCHKCYFE
jgi:hypothetical protein